MKLRLNVTQPDDAKERVQSAAQRKVAATETIDEAWTRILAMKNSDADQARLIEVKNAMLSGVLGRHPESVAKRFSKAEALRLYKELAESKREAKLAELVAKTPSNYVLVDTFEKLYRLRDDIAMSDIIAFDCETFGENGGALDPWRGKVAGFSVSTRRASYYVPINHRGADQLHIHSISEIWDVLEDAKIVMHNAPFDCKWFAVHYDVNLTDALYADTRIMAMSLDENRDHRLKNLLTDWLKQPSDNFDELFPNTPFNEISLDVALPYAAGDTEKTLALFDWISQWYDKRPDLQEIKRLFYEVEMPVQRQFIKSDLRGIRFDVEHAATLDAKLAIEEAELYRKITDLFGEAINLNSPAQLSKKLFIDLKLTDYGKGSTNSRFMKKLKREHPVIPLLLEYKEIGKLRSAFTQKLPKEVKSDGKIHPWHNTWGAATGRFTCKDPNTQQIPAKRPEVRQLFLATGPDRILVSIDYSQIELRVLAHMANEKVLIDAFEHGRDIHSTTAALISPYSYEEIEVNKDTDGSPQQKYRKQAKIVNFGIVYGMGAGKLADTLEITKKEAQKIIDDYFRGYPGIKRYMDEQHAKVMKQGFVTDIFGRKRRLHEDIKSKEKWRVFSAQRMGGNFPIQASAGSILKKAIVDLQTVLPRHDSHILLQVHDELVLDCPRNITEESLQEIKTTMEKAVKLLVPVRCDVEINPERWLEKVSNEDWFDMEEDE
ncbi:DNA polymerase [Bacillus sp. 03113]|uniref:DNA polymerase n=1 Tax=Bacillus sp. 03113 TaxID=2578211 RepID=UPI00215B81A1|nr:DNA polymerase [Bacillus sp. 03113]